MTRALGSRKIIPPPSSFDAKHRKLVKFQKRTLNLQKCAFAKGVVGSIQLIDGNNAVKKRTDVRNAEPMKNLWSVTLWFLMNKKPVNSNKAHVPLRAAFKPGKAATFMRGLPPKLGRH